MAVPCIFFQQGRCRNGDTCRFSHSSAPVTHPQSDPRAQVPCKFYLEGICKQGVKCPYRHEPSESSASAQVPPQRDNDTFIRVFRGALVRYGDGACVTSLSLPSEYSSVRLDGLAANTTAADVISVLEDLGHDIEIDGLRIVAMPRSLSSLCSAYISTPDLEFSKTLSTSLIDAPYRNLKAVPVPPRLPSWASTRRARCNQLKLKWTSPRSECCVFFDSYVTALRVTGKFNGGKYKVRNTRVHCDEPIVEPITGCYSVMVSGLPYRCNAEMVEDSITAGYDSPLEIVVQRRNAWKRNTEISIKELLNDVGPIDSMTEPVEHKGGIWTAYAHFEQDCDAQEAARVIEERSHILPYDVNLKVNLLYSSTFKVSKEVYYHVQQRLQDRLDELDAPRLKITCRETYPVLSLNSQSSEELAKCANAIEEIVAGDVIVGKDGNPFWAPQLACNGAGSKVLKEIQQRHGVLLLPNRSKREVRYFGDSWTQLVVQEDVVRSLTEDQEIRHAIDIDNDGFVWLCKVGLSLLKDVVGDKVVSLNVTTDPKKLIITGSDEEYCQVLALLEMSDISFAVKEVKSVEEGCSICFTPADEPVVLSCGHTYCTDCFKGLCRNGTTQADVRVACTGAEDKCKNAIPLREIQAHVDISTFEQLLESSFNMYVARRPDEFHYCPTPDCGYIYRPASASASSSWHMCTKCLQRICRSCHANHDGQRCDQYQAAQAFETYKHENRANVKDCPKCKTTVEKIDGCNHIHCGGCKIHLCWVCLKTFEESPACYKHMNEAHGRIGIEDEDDEVYVDDIDDDDDE
ncbi:hypothetical protein FHL15_005697 [Xylaria flabelliformis]|uniref:RING-type E3 ubiquitin transferase n=1 Tax=Xylaria flabelliformis TaxID=2512241 RepID=A0A553HZP5_9PEZI|nr:hypothetical protein FHL15_005697 [Xylaria flabelliformis]